MQVQLPSEHTAASVLPTNSSATSEFEPEAPPQATSRKPDIKAISVDFFMLHPVTVVSSERV
jgi:hypothetical protein